MPLVCGISGNGHMKFDKFNTICNEIRNFSFKFRMECAQIIYQADITTILLDTASVSFVAD
jgi:hypothetical protein